jgi:uncharacterized protein YbjT (DUF2867 family)
MRVLLLGATGLIGRHCLSFLLAAEQVSEVVAPTRRSLQIKDQRLHNVLVDFDRLDEYRELFEVDAIVCCLGTTIKQAGSKARFKQVDYKYCLDAAELGRANSVPAFLLVSAIGASQYSPFFYSRVKGELEAHLRELEYPSLSIFRPSLLLGEREELRLGEVVAAKITPLLNPMLVGRMSAYRAIDAEQVAKAMVNVCLISHKQRAASPLVKVYRHDKIVKLAA